MDFLLQIIIERIFPMIPTMTKMVPKMELEYQCIFLAMAMMSSATELEASVTLLTPASLMTSKVEFSILSYVSLEINQRQIILLVKCLMRESRKRL